MQRGYYPLDSGEDETIAESLIEGEYLYAFLLISLVS